MVEASDIDNGSGWGQPPDSVNRHSWPCTDSFFFCRYVARKRAKFVLNDAKPIGTKNNDFQNPEAEGQTCSRPMFVTSRMSNH